MRFRRAIPSWGLLAAVLFGASSAEAESKPEGHGDEAVARVWLQWEAPPGCPERETMVSATEAWLSKTVFVTDRHQADYVLQGRIGRLGGGPWLARIRLFAEDGRSLGVREVVSDSPRCSSMKRPLSLVLALLVDLEAPRRRLTVPPLRNEPEAVGRPPASDRPELYLAPFLEGSLGQVPGIVGGALGMESGLRWRAGWRVGGGLWWAPGRSRAAFGGRTGMAYVSVFLKGCIAWKDVVWGEAGPCIAVHLGHSERWGSGYVLDRRHERPYAAGEGSWAFRWPLSGWLSLRLEGGLRWQFERPLLMVRVDGVDEQAFSAWCCSPLLRLALEMGHAPSTTR